ncbi:MAG: CRTAC1 family protein [Myxococcales bacterium]|nr:CRTAC1 family protein [Myxococcales bacterium]
MIRRSTVVVLAVGCGPVTIPDADYLGEVGRQARVETTLDEGGVITCADPSGRDRAPFDVSREAMPSSRSVSVWGGGVAAGDIDGDGDADVVATTEYGLGWWPGTQQGPRHLNFGLSEFDFEYETSVTVVDYDGDGWLDLYVGTFNGHPASPEYQGGAHLLHNRGDGTLEDVTAAAGHVDACGRHHRTGEYACYRVSAASFADVDHDGDLDLYVVTYGDVVDVPGMTPAALPPGDPDFLYLNNGDGTFTDVSEAWLPAEMQDGYGFAGGFFDLDDDGWQDVYVVNDMGPQFPNAILWNHEGSLEWEPASSTGLSVSITGMGLGMGDLNGDGWPDLAMPEWGKNQLLMSHADRRLWVNDNVNLGFENELHRGQHVGWGTDLADLDNDGDLDGISNYGWLELDNTNWSSARRQPSGVYLNEGTPTEPRFRDVARGWGLADRGSGRGILLADLDRDGWIDVVNRNVDGAARVAHARCGTAGWLEVELEDHTTANTRGIGARIRVMTEEHTLVRWITAGGTSFGVGLPPEVHFGLGPVDEVTVEVRWTDGSVDTFEDVPSRQRVRLVREVVEP